MTAAPTRTPRGPLAAWRARTQPQRVEFYTVATLYSLAWLMPLTVLPQLAGEGVLEGGQWLPTLLGCLALGCVSLFLLRKAMRLHPAPGPIPWAAILGLVVLALLATAALRLLPPEARGSLALLIASALGWGLGGFVARPVIWVAGTASLLVGVLAIPGLFFGAITLGFWLFFTFTVRSSLWIVGVINELERGREAEARLAVAEERLRFSQDVHDIVGRRLSAIALQAELAENLSGDAPAAAAHMREVRVTAHDALVEARELARGYRPANLGHELEGARALLAAAGITLEQDLVGLPDASREQVAWIVREAVTNVLRHSRASRVRVAYAGHELLVTNDGAETASGDGLGQGLSVLAERLATVGADLRVERTGGDFTLRVALPGPGNGGLRAAEALDQASTSGSAR